MINFANPSTGHEELHRKVNRIQGEVWGGCVTLPQPPRRHADDTAVSRKVFLGGLSDAVESSDVRISEVFRESVESLYRTTEEWSQSTSFKSDVLRESLQAFTEASQMTSLRENLRTLFERPDEPDWNDAKNDRRCDLIDKEIEGTLLPAEKRELAQLQRQMLAYRRKVAPLPLKEAQRLHQHLLMKAAEREG